MPTDPDDLNHWVCCDDNLATCGEDVTDAEWVEFDQADCIICDLLKEFPCRPGCYGTTAGVYTPYITRGDRKWSAHFAPKETTPTVRDALVSIVRRLKWWA